MTKKTKIIIVLITVFLLILMIVLSKALNSNVPINDNASTEVSETTTTNVSNFNIIGTWYSDKPDKITFNKDGTYQGAEWNGSNSWLSSGNYTVENNLLTLKSEIDGTTILKIDKDSLIGKYTYYNNEEAANLAINIIKSEIEEDEANIIPNTINKLLGEWISLDGSATCTFTEKNFVVHCLGNNIVPEKSLYYEYEILSEKKIAVTENGNKTIYTYKLYEEKGEWYLLSPIKVCASTYKKINKESINVDSSTTNNTNLDEQTKENDLVISSEENPDLSQYAEELNAYVNKNIIGTWKGSFNENPTTEDYWIYTFNKDGTYQFTDGIKKEEGTYTIVSDPNNNYYHSKITLVYEEGSRIFHFYFTTTDPLKMITDDQNDPTFLKS